MNGYIQISTTTGNKKDAETIARRLVESRLAACVQITGPIKSTYLWKDVIETEEEWLCLIKTVDALYEKIENTILDVHPYEVPEIIAVPVVKGSSDYLSWIQEVVKD